MLIRGMNTLKATQQRTLGSDKKELILVCWELGRALYRKRQLMKLLAAAVIKERGDKKKAFCEGERASKN
jgi:hypothetical protein